MKDPSVKNVPDFRCLLEAAPDLYLVLDADLNIVTASDAYLKATMTRREDVLYRPLFEVFPDNPDDPQATGTANLAASIKRAIDSHAPDAMAIQQYDIRKPDEEGGEFERRYWSVTNTPIFVDGKITYIIHRVEDVTAMVELRQHGHEQSKENEALRNKMEAEIYLRAQKIAEANRQLHNSRSFLKNIIDSVPDPIFVKDEKHRLIEGNNAMWELFGRPEHEIIGKTDYDFFPKEEADVFLEKDNEVFASGKPNINVENFTDAAGVTHIISTKKACFATPNGERILVGVIRDISELTRIQAKLKESDEARLKSIMDHSGRMVYIKDQKGAYVQVNRNLLELINKQEHEVIGKTDFDLFPANFAEEFRKNDLLVLSHGTAIEFEEVAPNGDEVHVYTSVKFPLYDANGVIYAVCGISTDITERKQAEIQLQQTMEELTESNIELERFAYICSHDLQEPLRMISNYTQRLVKHIDKQLDDRGKRYVQYILDGAANARDLIDDVLTYARIGTESEKEETVDCNHTLAIVLKHLVLASKEAGAKITYDPLPTVYAHKTRVAQLVQNLISNAIKFAHPERAPEIHISATLKNGAWEFAVRDNGIGIPKEYHEKIFIIFQRLNKRHDYPGTGIGLALCKKIVDSYDGKMWLESIPDQGSTFYFTLPDKRK